LLQLRLSDSQRGCSDCGFAPGREDFEVILDSKEKLEQTCAFVGEFAMGFSQARGDLPVLMEKIGGQYNPIVWDSFWRGIRKIVFLSCSAGVTSLSEGNPLFR
jgi:hypothetical protein